MSYSIHSQDEDQYSTDYNAMSPSRTYFLPITPQKTMLPRPSAMLPRPSRIPISKTRYTTQTQHKDKLITQKTKSSPRPSCIPVLNNNRHNPTPQVTKPEAQSTIYSLPRPSEETIPKQPTQIQPTPVTRSPLLPTPPAHYRRSTSPRSSASTNSSRNSTFSRPSTVISRPTPTNNYRFHQNSYISRPYTPAFNNQRPPLLPRPSYQHQNFITGPHQQHQQALEHFFTRPYQQNQQPVYNIHISLPYYTA